MIPPYDAILLTRPGLALQAPDVIAALEGLVGSIDERTMRRLNQAVDEGGESPDAVARAHLRGP